MWPSRIQLLEALDSRLEVTPTTGLNVVLTKLINLRFSYTNPSNFVQIGPIADSHRFLDQIGPRSYLTSDVNISTAIVHVV